MPTYKLTYFNAKGRAELTRFLFAQAGVEYEDVRLTQEQFAEMKPNILTGTLPLLEVDGTTLNGSAAIAMYVAYVHGLAGTDIMETARITGFLDVLRDYQEKWIPVFFGDDEDAKEKARVALKEQHTPRYLHILETMIKNNNSPDGWAFGNQISIADMALCVLIDPVTEKFPDLDAKFPAIRKNIDAVKAQPKIAEYLANRPETPF